MKTIELKLYRLNELPEEVQAEAIERFRQKTDLNHVFDEYALPTFKAFCFVFGVEQERYSVGAYGSAYATGQAVPYREDTDLESLKGNRLRTWIINNFDEYLRNKKMYYLPRPFSHDEAGKRVKWPKRKSKINYTRDCPLTGVYIDEDILEPLRDFIKEPDQSSSFQDIVDRCLDAWAIAAQQALEYEQSDEAIKDLIMSNEYYFDEFGNMSRYG